MAPGDNVTIHYADGTTAVAEGDIVEYRSLRFWRGWQQGHVSYVPGISPPHPQMEHHDIRTLGVSGVDGTFRGIYIEPETNQALPSIRFVSRGDLTGIIRPEDIKPDEW